MARSPMTTDRERLSKLRYDWWHCAYTEPDGLRKRIAEAAVRACDDVLDTMEE